MLAPSRTQTGPALRGAGAQRCAVPRARVAAKRATVAHSSSPSPAAPVAVATESCVHSLTGAEFEDFVAAHNVVLVDYYADWCGPCKLIAPHLEVMAQEMPGVTFAKLNCTSDPVAKKIAMSSGIKALPTFHLFRQNARVGVFVGGKPAALRKFLEENL